MITQLGADPFGDKITRALAQAGIDTSCISYTEEANTALAFVSLAKDGNRTFSFYRKPSADMLLNEDQIKQEWFDDAFALHFCSVSLGDFPMRGAHVKAITSARKENAMISFDPNLRFQLWDNKEELKNVVRKFISMTDILKISDEELGFITGMDTIEKALPLFFDKGVKLVIFTCGSRGAYSFTRNNHAFSPAGRVKAVDTTGAGDGFIGAFLWKLHALGISADNIESLTEADMNSLLEFANRFCAISVQSSGAIDSYPSLDEI